MINDGLIFKSFNFVTYSPVFGKPSNINPYNLQSAFYNLEFSNPKIISSGTKQKINKKHLYHLPSVLFFKCSTSFAPTSVFFAI